MTYSTTLAIKTASLTAQITAAGASSTIVTYGGTPPTNADTALSSNPVLVTNACSATPATVSGGVLTFNAVTDATIGTSGTATFSRWLASNGTTVIGQGTVGTSGADMLVGTTTLTSGAIYHISANTITQS